MVSLASHVVAGRVAHINLGAVGARVDSGDHMFLAPPPPHEFTERGGGGRLSRRCGLAKKFEVL